MKKENRLIVILGPTASGKTRLATQVASRINGAIISADSRQVYRDMDIGTGKDLDEYMVNGRPIPHYLINVLPAGARYNIFQYYLDYLESYRDIELKKYHPILCGGSGLYLETALKGHKLSAIPINPELRATIAQKDKEALRSMLDAFAEDYRRHADYSSHKRLIRAIEIATYLEKGNPIPPTPSVPHTEKPLIIGMKLDREERRRRITERLEARLQEGLIEEVEGLLAQGISEADLSYYGLEYKWVSSFILGQIDRETMFQRLNTGIHQFAKRQMTWFRKMEKDGWAISWINVLSPIEAQTEKVLNLLENN